MLQSNDHTTYDTRGSFKYRLYPGINTVITGASARQFLNLYRACNAIRHRHTWQCGNCAGGRRKRHCFTHSSTCVTHTHFCVRLQVLPRRIFGKLGSVSHHRSCLHLLGRACPLPHRVAFYFTVYPSGLQVWHEAGVEDEEAPAQAPGLVSKWRQKERLKTTAVALVLCLNIGVDPPDVLKISPCARLECWVDPLSMQPPKALETIGACGPHAPPAPTFWHAERNQGWAALLSMQLQSLLMPLEGLWTGQGKHCCIRELQKDQ